MDDLLRDILARIVRAQDEPDPGELFTILRDLEVDLTNAIEEKRSPDGRA